MRRVKNVAYDDDWDDGDWGGGSSWSSAAPAAPKKNKAKAAPAGKAVAKASTAPSAKTKAAAAPAATSVPKALAVPEELRLALSPEVPTERLEKALSESRGKPEVAFLKLLEEEVDAGRWVEEAAAGDAASAVAPPTKNDTDRASSEPMAEDMASREASEAFAPPPRDSADAQGKPKAKKQEEKQPSAPDVEEEDLPQLGEGEAGDDARPCISLVVVGHVDAGKSTMMGHLLCLVGEVSSKVLHKFEKESKLMNKASFAYAWVLDEGEDERSRGVTIDVCVKHFATKSKRFTILDAPGHRDFVPNMLQGAVQADVAMIVVDVSHFEAGFEKGGQTKEHLQLVRVLGMTNLVVAVNKLDTADWSEEVFENIKGRMHGFVVGPECGFKAANVTYVPVSGFTGENMMERKEAKLCSWWKGPTLLEALDQLPLPSRPPPTGALRMPISDLYRSGSSAVASGKVEAGTMTAGQKVLLLPSNEQTTVKSLTSRNMATRRGQVGEYMDGVVMPIELQFASIGGVICDAKTPVPVVDTFFVKLLVFDVDVPIMKGQQFMCFLHVEMLRATLVRLEKLIVKGKEQDRRPKCLTKGNTAIVQMRLDRKVCLEPAPKDGPPTSLSRLVLRDRGRTVAAGAVQSVS